MADRARITIGRREIGEGGISPRQLGEVIGRTAKPAIDKDGLIAWDDLV
jgi:hypothetical protein